MKGGVLLVLARDFFVVSLLILTVSIANAATRNDVPSCRQHFLGENNSGKASRGFFIVVDRTVSLDKSLQSDIVARAVRAIRPGDRVVLITFSGLTQNEFTEVQFDGRLDQPLRQEELENDLPARLADNVQACFVEQMQFVRGNVGTKLQKILSSPLDEARRSEIILALTEISRGLVSTSASQKNVVLLVSDMIEFSDVASFYRKTQLRLIQPDQVLEIVKHQNLIGNFGGGNLYVAGAAASTSSQNRGVAERQALREFWLHWFSLSNATVREWGDPALLDDIE